ncbi:hypothetical protein OBBRIDRAFT_803062 [Obba rivulosa]|uniref:F-box domain-containing protein n=1 Tax=Obba rivulosa TaxID=1052685 RepID=A0A8E2AVE2_9APHY|nr:hypothetical protein OBBRIDRAFT_803062 [Obba rivulosa]
MATTISPESLKRIFFFTYAPWHHQTQVRTSHVCRYWREVALAYSDLWCTVTFSGHFPSNITLLHACSERARPKLVEVRVTGCRIPHAKFINILEAFMSNAERIQSIQLFEMGANDIQRLDFRMPNLELMHMDRNSDTDEPQLKPIVCQFPRLNHLRLAGTFCPWDWSLSNFASLTQLYMVDCWSKNRPLLTSLLSMLGACPLLKRLDVIRCLPNGLETSMGEDTAIQTISLPALSILEIDDYAVNTSNFLIHVDVPVSCAIGLTFYYGSAIETREHDKPEAACAAVSWAVSQQGDSLRDIKCLRMRISCEPEADSDAEEDRHRRGAEGGWDIELTCIRSCQQGTESKYLEVRLIPDVRNVETGKPHWEACSILLAQSTVALSSGSFVPTCLHIDGTEAPEDKIFELGLKWDQILQHFPAVERIEVEGSCLDLLLDDLGVIPGVEPNCPALKHVTIHFTGKDGRRDRAVRTCIGLRAAAGKRFATLTFTTPAPISATRNQIHPDPEKAFNGEYLAYVRGLVDDVRCIYRPPPWWEAEVELAEIIPMLDITGLPPDAFVIP